MTSPDPRSRPSRPPRPPRRGDEVADNEIGPLGLGQDPVKDPLKSFNGMVIASSLIMESITLVLALPLLYKLYDGTLWTPFNYGVVVGALIFHLGMIAFMNKKWALTVIVWAQLLGLILGFMAHWSIAAIFIIFGMEWLLAAYLRSNLIARMKRGYLTTQHLNQK
ncbi:MULTISPECIES: DUF4233 domain-containing protein [Corynebacterium]|jgi:hypothetical protein|uniref:DUF4233 domain-containing protein n=1 Tax=Corynebacterium accolens TaxID=38284 RepID=A0AAP4FBS8_9CORY|nr:MULTISPECIES: DUF4233 domain-containing protein [Corynebacterium]HDM2782510.1 DUF4233 domain-containing protein [Staphylococcus aureus]EFM42989.1 hypothetical protein HMPREF0277_1929 [Corynebacterium accolens ATCC 49726]ERS41789.1 hypothetical protein HMPREF1293_01938 [Corynebacterium sp. KPL1996]ERS44618.1 hypothetical protein HMPREF1287_01109 [Corynebacterium sp. KPL1986]ERS51887.1 hypothetical protein HMPREF1267_02004 [Corynebacterium sp. KPL1824]